MLNLAPSADGNLTKTENVYIQLTASKGCFKVWTSADTTPFSFECLSFIKKCPGFTN